MTKKILTSTILLCGAVTLYSQVGIGTTNPQGIFHVDGAKNNPVTGLPNSESQKDDFIILQNGKIGIGTINPSVRLDVRAENNSNSAVAVGYTSKSATDAGAGAMRYTDVSGGLLQLSDGENWGNLLSNPKKSFVAAHIVADNGTITFSSIPKAVSSWTLVKDNNNDFDTTTGIFTARRDGIYNVNFSYDLLHGSITAGSNVETQFIKNTNEIITKCLKTFGKSTRNSQAGGICNASVALDKGETLKIFLSQTISTGERGLRSTTTVTNGFYGFNNISIVEL